MYASENKPNAPLIVINLLQFEEATLVSFADMTGATKGYKSFMLHSIPMTRILSQLLILVMHPIRYCIVHWLCGSFTHTGSLNWLSAYPLSQAGRVSASMHFSQTWQRCILSGTVVGKRYCNNKICFPYCKVLSCSPVASLNYAIPWRCICTSQPDAPFI